MLSCSREGCDKKFTRRFNLESHVLGEHEGKKPFSCAYAGCGKTFAMEVNLDYQLINELIHQKHKLTLSNYQYLISLFLLGCFENSKLNFSC